SPRNTSFASSAKNESRNARRSRQKAFAIFSRLSARASRSPTFVGAASRRRFSFRNPQMRKQSSSATAKTVCRSSLAMEVRQRRLRGGQRPTGTTTRKGPRLRVRLCRWRKRLLLHWRHRPKRYRLPVRVLRRALTQRLAGFGRSVYLISKPILRSCYSQLSGRQSLAQASRPSDPATVRLGGNLWHILLSELLAVMLSVPFVAISYTA